MGKSKKHLDFGPGFYTTPNKQFAINTAQSHTRRYNQFRKWQERWAVLEFECDEERLSKLNRKHFDTASGEWARFILTNRTINPIVHGINDNNLFAQYDCVSGPTADGKAGCLTPLIAAIDEGTLTLETADFSLFTPSQGNKWGEQYSFHTEEAIACIICKGMI